MGDRRGSALAAVAMVAGLASPAYAFRDDLPEDMARDCVPGSMPDSAGWREQCALSAIAQACAVDPSRVPAEIARVIGVDPIQVRRAHGRHTLASLQRGHLCERGERERQAVIAASYQAKKVRSESAKKWLMETLAGPDGTIDTAGVARALEQREEILRRGTTKRAGLPASPAGWTNLTNYSQSPGRINHILFTSGTGTELLAGADGGGIWRSTDSGVTWSALNDFLGSLSITNFAKAANDASTIYAATNDIGSHTHFPFGILKSTNGGVSWSQVAATNPATNADFTFVQRVAVHPTNSQVVLAATYQGGAYQSDNGGTSWTKVAGINTPSYSVAFHPTDGNRRAIAYNDGTVRYTTTGDLLGAGASTATVRAGGLFMKVAYAKSDLNRMYALVTDGTARTTHLYRSVNGGSVWTEVSGSNAALTTEGVFYNSSYLSYTGGLWVDPVNANRVGVFEAWAGFTADVSAPTPTWKSLYSGWVDFHGMVEDPGYNGTSNKIVWFMDDGGLYRVGDVDLLDQAGTFARRESGLTVTEVYSVSGHGGNPIFGAQDTGPKVYRTDVPGADPTSRWRFTRTPVGYPGCSNCSWIGDGMTTAASTSNPLVLYGSLQYLNLFRSNDGGITSSSIAKNSALADGGGATTPNTNASFLAPFVLDPSNQSRMLAGGLSLWRSNNVDSGNPPTWTAIKGPNADAGCVNSPITHIAIAPSNSDVVWIAYACNGRLYKSANATQASPTWTQVTTAPTAANQYKGTIAIDTFNPNVVWVGTTSYFGTNTLFKTTDGGATAGSWSAVPGLPVAPVYALLQHPNSVNWLYAGTGVGLFASQDGGATWSTSNEGPANVVVRSLDWNTTGISAELLVGTFGRGVWKATVSYAALAASTTTMVSSVASPTAPTSITFTATVSGGAGTPTGNVVFRDGGVDLATVALNGSAQAAFTTSSLVPGAHSITANYQGSGTYSPSASVAFPLTISAAPTTTAMVSSAASPAAPGTSITFTATVSGTFGPPTGAVTFRDGTTDLATVSLNGSGQAAFTTSALAPGAHGITASYQGSATYAASVSSTFFLTINPAASTTTLAASVASPAPPGSITFTATVAGAFATPTGSVTFRDGGADLGTVALSGSGQAAFATSALAAGSHSITAFYAGSSTYLPSTSAAFPLTIQATNPPRLINISTRMQVLTGNDVMIGGFVIGGAGTKRVAIVATGPSLSAFGIANPLANPTMRLVRSSDQAVLATNDNWQTAPNASQLTAAGFAPTHPLESAILVDLPPGAYTAIVEGASGATGVAVVAVYEVDHPEIPLVNISTRGRVLTGNDVMIGGFVIAGSAAQIVAIVATGPSLSAFGIASPLANPTLRLVRSSDQVVLATNDNWASGPNAAQLTSAGFAPTHPLEAAIYALLPPGAYTAIVEGVGGGTGVAVIGVYRVN